MHLPGAYSVCQSRLRAENIAASAPPSACMYSRTLAGDVGPLCAGTSLPNPPSRVNRKARKGNFVRLQLRGSTGVYFQECREFATAASLRCSPGTYLLKPARSLGVYLTCLALQR